MFVCNYVHTYLDMAPTYI